MRLGPLLFVDTQEFGMNDRADYISIGGPEERKDNVSVERLQ